MTSERRILVPVHASRSSRAALARARMLAQSTGAGLRLLSVVPLRARAVEQLMAYEDAATALSGDLAEMDRALPMGLEERWVRGDPLAVILAEAARPDVDFVVIGHGERGWWSRGLTAPLHERVVRYSSVPVLVVNTEDAEREEAPRPRMRLRPEDRGAASGLQVVQGGLG